MEYDGVGCAWACIACVLIVVGIVALIWLGTGLLGLHHL